MKPDEADPGGVARAMSLRPQSLMFAFLGDWALGEAVCIYSGSFIDVFERVGVSEHATRSTLTRMVHRGLLRRQRAGRRVYFGLTEHSRQILLDGRARIWQSGAVNDDWDGTWTLLGFSLPESWQRQRHDLRSRLVWAGFGPLQSGLWIAPSTLDVTDIVEELGLDAHVKVFLGQPGKPTDVAQLLRDAYDLDGLSGRYRAFLARWDRPDPLPGAPDDLARRLLLSAEWLRIVRQDPRLPVEHLPVDWPAGRAQQVFHGLHATFDDPARRIVCSLLDTVPAQT